MEWNRHAAKKRYLAQIKAGTLYCYLCGMLILSEKDFSFDHVFPKSRGGQTTDDNMKPAHKKCNSDKGNMLLEEYLVKIKQKSR